MGKFLDAVMNKSIFRLVIIVLLGMFSMAANAAFVSKVINQTSEAMIVTFYNMACQTCQMTVKNANVTVGPYQTVNFNGDYSGSYYVKNNGVLPVQVDVTQSDGSYVTGYGILYQGNGVYDVWIGGGGYVVISNGTPAQCSASTLNWGTSN